MTNQTAAAFAREDEVIPDDARFVRDFINTVEYQEGFERLQQPSDLDAWIAERGLRDESIASDQTELERVLGIRDGLRAVLSAHAGHTPDADALARLDLALAEAPVRISFRDPERPALTATRQRPVDAALGRVLAAVHSSMVDGTWSRLKVCDRSSCQWAYYDYSRNRSARWCTMAGCGNAVKMQRAYANRKARSSGARTAGN
jgi:predicted RNA-binding Zn ribbon-like protein